MNDTMMNVLREYGTEPVRELFAAKAPIDGIEELIADEDIYRTTMQLICNALQGEHRFLNLWVEDLELADRWDLDFLRYLQSECHRLELPLHLVIAVRSGRKPDTVRHFITHLDPDFHLRLRPWSEDEVTQFLYHNYGIKLNSSNREFAEEFYRQVGGLPFRITQTMAYLQEKRILVEKKNHGWGIRNWRNFHWPESLEEVLKVRLKRLPRHATTWKVLTTLSQMHDPDDHEALEEMVGLSSEELSRQLSLLYCNGFLDREYRIRQRALRDMLLQFQD